MNLILHIGLYKTGTTYLQNCLWGSRKLLLNSGILFAPAMYNTCKYATIKTPLTMNGNNLVRNAFMGHSALSGIQTVLVSCETLCNINDPELMIDQIEYWTADFENHKIVLCVRRQDEFLESVYAQNVKKGYEKTDFQDHADKIEYDNMDWLRLATAFSSAFPDFNCFPYETHKSGNLAKEFFGTFTDVDPSTDKSHINPTPSKEGMQKILEVNRSVLLTEKQKEEQRDDILNRYKKPVGETQTWFTDKQRRGILDHYSESNKKLFEKYMPNNLNLLRYYHGV